ncbi:MAG TPA: hypothetical protein VGI80_04810 [Pyrinomonadaceae bacterium]|jgi:hypothetical protein
MQRIFLLLTTLVLVACAFSCGSGGGSKPDYDAHGDTPTEAYKRLYTAVKSGSSDAIRAEMTKKTIQFAGATAKQMGKTEEAQISHGMTATTYSETVPEIRDERVKDNMGAVEVWNSKESKWEDLPFMIEDGKWKFAMGEAFADTWHSPGKGRNEIEHEAANALRPQTPAPANVNTPPAPKR